MHQRTTGKAVLQDLIGDKNHAEYCSLTNDKKAQLLQEYCKHKKTKTTGICISTKSKVNNVTWMLKAVENELKNLQTHTGTESIFYTMHGSMDLPLHDLAFATEGINEFMGSVINIDDQDLVSKMERFGVQGMKGAARNHQKCMLDIGSTICQEINKILCWLENVPFINLCMVSSTLPDMEMLLDKWETREIHWKHLDEDEYEKLHQEYREKSDIPGNTASCEHTPAGSISIMPEPTPPTVPSMVIPELASSTPPAVPSVIIPKLMSSTPPTVPSLVIFKLASSTPPTDPSLVIPKLALSTPPTVPSLVIPELMSTASLGSFFNGDMFGMDFLPTGHSTGISGMLDFMNFE
ncbi:hypothetical protein BDR04DRAFT_1164452 [Suillus decipiens]|nr:hypothetical protein BDR04DRAFT_1164452 [Suillus decipiens]